MPDPSDFAHKPPGGAAYGPGGGWAPDDGSPGIAFLRNPQQDRAAADKRVAGADDAIQSAQTRRTLFGRRTPFLGVSDEEVSGAQSNRDSARREADKIADFQRRKGGS